MNLFNKCNIINQSHIIMRKQENQTIEKRRQQNSRQVRIISRAQIFERNRRSNQLNSYMPNYDELTQQAILQSLNGPIPKPLPPLDLTTISYYRRQNIPVFKTYLSKVQVPDPHMTLESLWILAGQSDEKFDNYQQITKQFEKNLQGYLTCPFPQIKKMAIIVAGNKILGLQKDIVNIVKQDKQQIWILVNHIFQRRIPFTHLYQFLQEDNEMAYKTIFEMSNYRNDEIIESIMEEERIIEKIVMSLAHKNTTIQENSLRIIGNILAQKQEYALVLEKYNILEAFFHLLKSNNKSIRKDACWALSNFVFQKSLAVSVMHCSKLLEKLISLFWNETKSSILKELEIVMIHLIIYGQPTQVFQMLVSQKILDHCNDLMHQLTELQLIASTLSLVKQIIQIGEDFKDQQMAQGSNIFCLKILQNDEFVKKIRKYSCSGDKTINDNASKIEDFIDEYQ